MCYTHNMSQTVDCIWTDNDTAICERAEASGVSINKSTGNPMTFAELKALAPEYDKIRSTITVDEFLKDKINSKPFEF